MSHPGQGLDEPTSATSLADVRTRLRGLGYLDHSVERYLLQDALRPERPVRTVVSLALKVGVLGGVPLAAAATFLLAWANQLFAHEPTDILILFLHLLAPWVLGLGVGFMLLGGILALILHLSHARRIEMASMVAATAAACLFLGLAAFRGRGFLGDLGSTRTVLVALGALALAVLLIRVLHGGLLTVAIRLRDRPPERPVTRLVWQTAPVGLAVILLVVPALLGSRSQPTIPSSLPALAGARVAIIGVDGVRADDVESLLRAAALPEISDRLAAGGVMASYRRDAALPAAFWTTVITGLEPTEHGLLAVDGYRPLGLQTTLTRTGWLRPYFALVGAGTGLVDHRPVLAPSRRVPAVWDLASRGGVPVLVVNWWGTFPAEPLPGLMVAHGAYQLLPDAENGAVSPASESSRLADARGSLPVDGIETMLQTTPPEVADRLRDRALAPDLFYRQTYDDGLDASPRFAALYLPALDIAADLADLGSVTQADLVRWQLSAVDRLVARLGETVDTIVLVLDPGRGQDGTAGVEGRILIWRRDGACGRPSPSSPTAQRPAIEPAQVASALLRSLGLPQSRELASPPDVCRWPPPSLDVDTYGMRNPPSPPADGEEYLKNLRSLGYL